MHLRTLKKTHWEVTTLSRGMKIYCTLKLVDQFVDIKDGFRREG